ncbi:MAG TPA: PadR family transcriptional regulator [Agromyces mariniharenae]|nr:PadR family transcriptional regulator [Agromyces mariniharenae]
MEEATVERITGLGFMILSLLREGDMHPYEMMRLMRQRHDDRFVAIANGTFYHTVGRLERLGLLVEVGVDRAGNRPERTTYALTDAGRETVVEWVRRELPAIERPAEFRVALAEAHHLGREEVVALLHTRLAALAGLHQVQVDARREAREKDVPRQFILEVEREDAMLAAELSWLEDIITALEERAFPWGVAELDGPSPRYLADREEARR